MNYSLILLGILVCGAKLIYSQNPTITAYRQLKHTLASGYDKDISPNLGENSSTVIDITLHIIDLSLNKEEKTVDSDMYFRQFWTDPRLVNSESNEYVRGGQWLMDSIWTPDTFFPNSKSVRTVKYPRPNLFVKIGSNGTVLLSQKLQLTTRCTKKNETVYECDISFESYGYSAKDIVYKLKRGPTDSMSISDSILNPIDPDQLTLASSAIEERSLTLSTGNYSQIIIKLLFDNQPKETAEKKEQNLDDVMNEGKKLIHMLPNIKLPIFPRTQN